MKKYLITIGLILGSLVLADTYKYNAFTRTLDLVGSSSGGTTYTNSDGLLSIVGSVIDVTTGSLLTSAGTNTPTGSFLFHSASSTAPFKQASSDPATCDPTTYAAYWNTTKKIPKFCTGTNVWEGQNKTIEWYQPAGGNGPATGNNNAGTWFYPATVFATQGVIGSNIVIPTWDFTDASNMYIITPVNLPTGFKTLSWSYEWATAIGTGATQWGHKYMCPAADATVDVAIGSFTAGSAWATSTNSAALYRTVITPSVSITSASCTGGKPVYVAFFRDVTDASTATAKMLGVRWKLTYEEQGAQ